MNRVLIIIGGLLFSGAVWAAGSAAACNGPAACPAPNNLKKPQITCSSPHSASLPPSFTLHIYGKYLVNEQGPPRLVAYRDGDSSGTAGIPETDITVVSDCHIKLHVYAVKGSIMTSSLRPGDTIEFLLQRQTARKAERDVGRKGVITDWHRIKMTKGAGATGATSAPANPDAQAAADEDGGLFATIAGSVTSEAKQQKNQQSSKVKKRLEKEADSAIDKAVEGVMDSIFGN